MKLIKTSTLKLLIIFLGLVWVLGARAAFDSVQLSSGSTLQVTVSGTTLDLTVSSGNVEVLNVQSGSLAIDLAGGSSIGITSADRREFTVSGGVTHTLDCTASASTLTVSLSSGGSTTATVTPLTSTCTPSTGGGGGGVPPPPPPPPPPAPAAGGPPPAASPSPTPLAVAPAIPAIPAVPGGPGTPATPAIPAIPASPALLASPVFNFNFGYGASGEHVKRLQTLLNSDPATRVAAAGAGSLGRETLRFFLATRAAVIKFQIKYGLIARANSPGAGNVGPKTRAKLQQVFGGGILPGAPQPSPTPSVPQTGVPAPASANLQAQLRAAQQQLNALLQQLRARQQQ